MRLKIKKIKRKIKNNLLGKKTPKSSIEDVKKLLSFDLQITKGDSLIIGSSFGNLNADFSPKELILVLQELVGDEGNIVMPYYPPGKSFEWAESGQIFDMNNTPSSMGILTQVFSEMPDVYKSKHPTKAVVAWGQNAQEIVAGHENSTTPFYWDSPYGWLLKRKSKSVGLGLGNVLIFHAIEDTILGNDIFKYLYQKEKKTLKIIDYNNNQKEIDVLVHDPIKMSYLISTSEYVKALNLSSYKRRKFGYSFCIIVDNQQLFERCKKLFKNGNFRNKK